MTTGDDSTAMLVKLLQAAGMADASEQTLDVTELASELGVAAADVEQQIEQLHRMWLMLPGIEEGCRRSCVVRAGSI